MPEQRVHPGHDWFVVIEGRDWHLEFREQLEVEQWNAQISLLTGIAAAELMLADDVGRQRAGIEDFEDGGARVRRG